jgi:hypothetical protein
MTERAPITLTAHVFINDWGTPMPNTSLVTLRCAEAAIDSLVHVEKLLWQDERWKRAFQTTAERLGAAFESHGETVCLRLLVPAGEYSALKEAIRAIRAAE